MTDKEREIVRAVLLALDQHMPVVSEQDCRVKVGVMNELRRLESVGDEQKEE